MSIDYTQLQWWDRKIFVRSVAAFVAVLVGLLAWIEHVKPPEGYEFEKLPLLTGIYKCCEAGGRYSASWVGGTQVVCSPVSYFVFMGTPRNDCGLKGQINGVSVEVTRAVLPSLTNRSPLATRITSGTQVHYEIDDRKLRLLWIDSSRRASFSIAIIFFIILYGAQMSMLKPSPKK